MHDAGVDSSAEASSSGEGGGRWGLPGTDSPWLSDCVGTRQANAAVARQNLEVCTAGGDVHVG